MVAYYGDFAEDDTINIPFNTFSSDDPSASVTVTDLIDTDVYVFKDGSTTEYGADAAVTFTKDFDGNTGAHMCTIDLSENAYFATGSEYSVMLIGITVDGATLNVWIGSFSIERAGGALALCKTIQADLDLITGADGATLATAQGNYAPNTVVPDAAGVAATPAEVATALTDIHLDHLLHATYDPASKPGAADALLNEIVESDAGVSRFTENALEQAPSGTGASAAVIADAVWDEAQADHVGAGTFGVTASEIAAIPTTAMRGTDSAATEAKQDIIDNNVDTLITRVTAAVALASVCTEGRLAELDAANIPADIDAIPTTAMRGTDNAATEAKQDIIDTVLDAVLAMLDDARTEPGDIAPPVNPDAMTKLDYLYKFMRNKIETTATRVHVYDDAGTNKDHSSVISDDTTTFTRGEFAAGDA